MQTALTQRHYRAISQADAKRLFAIRPATPADNVVPMTGTAAGTAESKPGSRRKAR